MTGHRWTDVPSASVVSDVRLAVDRVFELLDLPQSDVTPVVVTAVSLLAEGADRLVADEILQRDGTDLEVILPRTAEDYVTDFERSESKERFSSLLAQARRASVAVVPVASNRMPSHADQYLEAGLEMLERSDVLIAVWDGEPGRGVGGTAHILDEARKRGLPVLWIRTASDGGIVEQVGGVERAIRSDDVGPLTRDAFDQLNRYNSEPLVADSEPHIVRLDRTVGEHVSALPDGGRAVYEAIDWIQPFYRRADQAAGNAQTHYFRSESPLYVFSALAVVAVAAQVAFRPTHPKDATLELLFLVLAFASTWRLRRTRLHDRWISARYLAEWLRTALFLGISGLSGRSRSVDPDVIVDAQAEWLQRAFREIWLQRPQLDITEDWVAPLRGLLSEAWLEHQRAYFKNSAKTSADHERVHHFVTTALLIVSLVCALFHVFGVFETLKHWWVFLSLSVPGTGAAWHAIFEQREYQRHGERYKRMDPRLAALRARLEAATDLESLREVAASVESLLREEASDWFGAVRLRHPELPF